MADQIQQLYNQVSSSFNPPVNNILNPFEGTTSVGALFLRIFLIVYASMVAPKLPAQMLDWFDWVPFRIFVLFLIAWSASHDPSVSILIAVGFYASINALQGKKLLEKYENRR